MERLLEHMREFVPLPKLQRVDSYVDFHTNRANVAAARALERKAAQANLKKLKELLAHALRYEQTEQDRGASISTRAQALLVAQTFFGALLAFATAIIGRADIFSGWRLFSLIGLLGYAVVLVVLLTINALRATSGLRYSRISTPELVSWLPKSEAEMIKGLATRTLANYRRAGIVNTWRSDHLAYAQQCLRNIVFALAALVAIVFSAVISIERWPTAGFTSAPFLPNALFPHTTPPPLGGPSPPQQH